MHALPTDVYATLKQFYDVGISVFVLPDFLLEDVWSGKKCHAIFSSGTVDGRKLRGPVQTSFIQKRPLN